MLKLGERVRLGVAGARELAQKSLRGTGYDAEEAAIVAEHVLDAALCGYEYSGLAKILNVAEHPRQPACCRSLHHRRSITSNCPHSPSSFPP